MSLLLKQNLTSGKRKEMYNKIKIGLVSATTVFMLSGCNPSALNMSAGMSLLSAVSVSDAQMQNMASQAAKRYDSKNRVASKRNKYAKRLTKLTRKLRRVDGLRLNYKVYLTKEINAFAMADGTVRVYSGLMDKMNDNELLFVIGHEIGHVHHKHSKKSYRTAALASAARTGLTAAGGKAGAMASGKLGALTEKLVNSQFSQSEESEADVYGLSFLQKAHVTPQAAINSLGKLARFGGSSTSSMFSSHPGIEKRIKDIKAQIR